MLAMIVCPMRDGWQPEAWMAMEITDFNEKAKAAG